MNGKATIYSGNFKAIKALKTSYEDIAKHLAEESDMVVEAAHLL